jgi:hypothetical protein
MIETIAKIEDALFHSDRKGPLASHIIMHPNTYKLLKTECQSLVVAQLVETPGGPRYRGLRIFRSLDIQEGAILV